MRQNAGCVTVIFLFSFACFFNSFRNGFAFDDHSIVDQNYSIRSAKNLPKMMFSSYWPISQGGVKKGLYRPLVVVSYACDYAVWKLKAAGYHLTNFIIHFLNSLLVFLVFRFVLKKSGAAGENDANLLALPGALFFAVHPVHVEAVTGVVGRAELMAAFFYMLALYAYMLKPEGREKDKKHLFPLSLMCYFAALLSKESAVTLPLTAAVYDIFFGSRKGSEILNTVKKNLKKYASYAGVFLVYMVVRVTVLGGISPQGTSRVFNEKGLSTKLYTMLVVFSNYVKMFFIPSGISPEKRDFPFFTSILDVKVLAGFAALALVVMGIIFFYKKNKFASFCFLWYLITLLPVSNIIPLGILIADRLIYLPSAGFAAAMVPLLFAGGRVKNLRLTAAGLLFIALLFSAVTVKRNADWKDDYTLWTTTVKRFPENYFALNNLGTLYYLRGAYDTAIDNYKKLIAVKPDYVEAWNNLAFAYKKKGMMQEAIAAFLKAQEIDPDYAASYNGLGYLYYENKKYEEAVVEYEKAIKADPELEEAYNNLGLVIQYSGNFEGAAEKYRKAIKINPEYENGHYNLGNVYYALGRYEESLKEFKTLEGLNPDNTETYKNIGIIYYSELSNYPGARAYLEKYLKLCPSAPDRETIEAILTRIKY